MQSATHLLASGNSKTHWGLSALVSGSLERFTFACIAGIGKEVDIMSRGRFTDMTTKVYQHSSWNRIVQDTRPAKPFCNLRLCQKVLIFIPAASS